MSGHSKWATIKHKKAALDAKRGKVFTKVSKEITVAAKTGGGDPAGNARLRLLIEKARAANMPLENITRAIKKGTGELPGLHYEEHLYEGYGPHGIAVILETLSDNKNRTVGEMRAAFTKVGGSLAEGGAVSWMFAHKGVFRVKGPGLTEEKLLELLIDFDLDDISDHEGTFTIECDPKSISEIKKVLEAANLTIESDNLEWVAANTITLSDEQSDKVVEFLSGLEDNDDVQNVYSNLG